MIESTNIFNLISIALSPDAESLSFEQNQNAYVFPVGKEYRGLFGSSYRNEILILQLSEENNVWQVSVVPENFVQTHKVHECFLLDNTEQISIGTDSQ